MSRRRGFTLVELLTVLAIVVILVSVAIPVVSSVRRKAQEATTAAQISSIDGAIQTYFNDFQAYPGPLPRQKLYTTGTPPAATVLNSNGGAQVVDISGTENLVLGLLGGLKPITGSTNVNFDQSLVGRGPRGLNLSVPKTHRAYIDNLPLSEGDYKDGAGDAIDSVIPEILDTFPNPMPLLYLRAAAGAGGVVALDNADGGSPINNASGSPLGIVQYDIREIAGYTLGTNGAIGEGKSIKIDAYKNFSPAPTDGKLPHGLQSVDKSKTFDKGAGTNYTYPYDAFPYFQNRAVPPTDTANPNGTGTPRNKDKYILISAGVDRVYGTADDITNFGSVLE